MNIWKVISGASLIVGVLASNGLLARNDSLHVEVLLNNEMLDNIHFGESFINAFEIEPNRFLLLSTNDRFFLLGTGNLVPLGKKVEGDISSFAFTYDSSLMFVRNNDLCGLDSLGNLSRLFKLPNDGMGICAGKYVMYVYDRNINQGKYSLYVIAQHGRFAKLFEIPTPIRAVVETDQSILFATGHALFSFNLKTKQLKALASLQKDKEIKSLTVDTSKNIIYFSTDNALYTLYDSKIITLTDQFTGFLRYYKGGLIVFNPEKKLLIRIVGIENRIASKIQEVKAAENVIKSTDTLTNSTIIDLVKMKVSDDLITKIIKSSKVKFNLSIDSMVYLSNQNVSSSVIMTMKNAMKRKAINIPNKSNH